jgi:hypothetical protein
MKEVMNTSISITRNCNVSLARLKDAIGYFEKQQRNRKESSLTPT